jgi:hypothetical protein
LQAFLLGGLGCGISRGFDHCSSFVTDPFNGEALRLRFDFSRLRGGLGDAFPFFDQL